MSSYEDTRDAVLHPDHDTRHREGAEAPPRPELRLHPNDEGLEVEVGDLGTVRLYPVLVRGERGEVWGLRLSVDAEYLPLSVDAEHLEVD